MFKFCCEDCGECWYVGNPRTCKCPDEEPQQPKQKQVEPVAWGMETDGLIYDVICPAEHEREEGEYTIPLYTTPQRTWVGLTEDEIHECFEECCNLKVVDPKGGVRGSVNIFDVGRAIEAKLKEKNT